jgi:hypothetical protein
LLQRAFPVARSLAVILVFFHPTLTHIPLPPAQHPVGCEPGRERPATPATKIRR